MSLHDATKLGPLNSEIRRVEGVQERGSDEDIWALERRGKRGLDETA